MRPSRYYAIFDMGTVTHIAHGYREARKASPHRGYKPFRTEHEAEEFAAWWNFDRASTKEQTFLSHPRPS